MPVVARHSFLAILALTIFAGGAAARPQSNPAETPAAHHSPPAKRGLDFSIGNRGVESLSYNGQSLLASPENGELRPQKSVFRAVLDALLPRSSPGVVTPNRKGDTVDLSYPWGRVSCNYGKQDDKITMHIEVLNSGAKQIDEFSLHLLELNFPSVPKGGTLEAGM